jgi:hypothetical protein
MGSAEAYLRIEQENAARDPRFGFDYADIIDESLITRQFVDAVLRHSGSADYIEGIPRSGVNLRQNLRQMPRDVQSDIVELLPTDVQPFAKDPLFGALPIGVVNGCVLRHDREGVRLDRCLVMLNYGLMLGCDLLSDALTLEILKGDLAHYAGDGTLCFQYATKVFLSPTADVVNATRIKREWPQDIQGQFAVHSGALTSIMLKFVGLHEVGHIVNGDIENTNSVSRLAAVGDESSVVEYARPISEAEKNWPCEFAADAFATRYLCDWTGRPGSSWSNVAQVYLFFSWLEHVEKMRGRSLCVYHPRAADRKEAVKKLAYCLAQEGPPEDYFAFIDERISAWSSL